MIPTTKDATSETREAAGEDHGTNTGPGAPGNGVASQPSTLNSQPATSPTEALQHAIAAYRSEVSARRARAFIDCPDTVLGLSLRPVTPPTWTMLQAIGSRLLTADTPLEGDVRNYLWFHSRLFALSTALRPPPSAVRLFKWLALLPFSARLHQRRDIDWYAATLATAINEIRGLLSDALADAPRGDRACSPGPCLEAQLIHFCAVQYGWSPAQTRATPLRQLMQYVRAATPTDDDEGERDIRFAHLRQRNAELQAAKNPQVSGFRSQVSS